MNFNRITFALNEDRDQIRLIEIGEEGETIQNINITETFMNTAFIAFGNENGEPRTLVNTEGNGFEITVKVIKKNKPLEKKSKLIIK